MSFFIKQIKFILLCQIAFFSLKMHGQQQKLGDPVVVNHTVKDYKAGAQNWDVEFTDSHVFFANNDGLLTFDGYSWLTFPTPNQTIIRSICKDKDNKIYVGAQNELGYFEPTPNGSLQFKSLLSDISRELKEIWFIEVLGDAIFFCDRKNIYCLKDNKLIEFENYTDVSFMAKIDSNIIFQPRGKGLCILDRNQNITELGDLLIDKEVVSISNFNQNRKIIATTQNGLFIIEKNIISPFQTNCDDVLRSNRISTTSYSPNHGLIVGTHLNGIINIKHDGTANYHINKNKGLHNNSISCITFDKYDNLWLGLFNGIDEIKINKPNFKFYPDNDLQGTVYDVEKWKGNIYFSTSNGLFYKKDTSYLIPFAKSQFELVKGTEGQTWSTTVIQDKLYCQHHTGLYQIDHTNQARKITNIGAWTIQQLNNDLFALGHYEGISILTLDEKSNLKYSHEVKGINESCRFLTLDTHNNLWVSHPFKNVYRINFFNDYADNKITKYGKGNGLKDDLHNYITNIGNECYVTNKTGVYKYNHNEDVFQIDNTLNNLIADEVYFRRIIQLNNNVWIISDKSTFCYTSNNSEKLRLEKIHQLNFPTKENYVGGFENLVELNDSILIIPTQEGAYYYNLTENNSSPPQATLKKIISTDGSNSILYNGFGKLPSLDLRPHENNLKLVLGSKQTTSISNNKYSVKFDNENTSWSPWEIDNIKEFTSLNSGKHQLMIKAINNYNVPSTVFSFDFNIQTPWYKSSIAKTIYLLLAILFLLSIIYFPRKKYEETTARLEDENQIVEAQLSLIKQEKLEDEIRFKNQELASTALHLMQKNQTLNSVKNKVNILKKDPINESLKKDLNEIIKIIRSDLRLDEDWNQFSLHFDQVHQDFIKNLKLKHPQLTTKDHKLSAFLKMGLTTKEISPLLNISVRGVEISRYRLRKKLNLQRSVDLGEFLNNI